MIKVGIPREVYLNLGNCSHKETFTTSALVLFPVSARGSHPQYSMYTLWLHVLFLAGILYFRARFCKHLRSPGIDSWAPWTFTNTGSGTSGLLGISASNPGKTLCLRRIPSHTKSKKFQVEIFAVRKSLISGIPRISVRKRGSSHWHF